MPYELMSTPLNLALVRGLEVTGQLAEGMTLVDETIRGVEANGDLCYMSELLRVKGNLLLSMPQARRDGAEMCFMQSVELSRRQGARAWELRAAVDMASLLAAQARTESARTLLQPVFDQFVEGFDTADLKSAARLLETLS
jgi:predicted ATPase